MRNYFTARSFKIDFKGKPTRAKLLLPGLSCFLAPIFNINFEEKPTRAKLMLYGTKPIQIVQYLCNEFMHV